ncbi:MAG TPA: helicase C-terminal domain-containing protein [Spirochaetia bacterium]|nr:helicase C-terminal domain-containing protein [Spirochaetia bacterium]
MFAIERIDPSVIEEIRNEINEANGSEVAFVGTIDDEGIVREVRAVAHGNLSQVPAPMPHLERGDVVIHNHPGGTMRPSSADIGVAAELGNLGIGSYIVDNSVERIYVIVEPVPARELTPIDGDALAELLSGGERISSIISGFEPRESQTAMLRLAARALNESRLCVAEAGTGVGKSFAYLIPALAWAEQNDERVVISTATINLQQQLVEKDIPIVKKLLGSDAKVALVKGRGNYLCLNRLEELAEEEAGLFEEPGSELNAIRAWAETTPTGSKSDLPFVPDESLWSQICSDADSCSGMRCRNRDTCFILRARKEAAGARLLVANHHLLFSDLSLRLHGAGYDGTAVLPPFQRVIIDEAHNIENAATSYFSDVFSRFSVLKYVSRLHRNRRGRSFGLLVQLERLLGRQVQEAGALLSKIRERADDLDSSALQVMGDAWNYRLCGEPTDLVRELLLLPMHNLQIAILDLVQLIEDEIATLSDDDRELPEVYDTRTVLRRFEEIGSMCQRYNGYAESPDQIFWIERARTSNRENFIRFYLTPLEIAPVMREALYEPFESVIFTSATLTVQGRFDFWMSRVGLSGEDPDELLTASFPSPFPYHERVLLGVPSDAPLPDQPGYSEYLQKFIIDVLRVSEGRALVLFTSYEMLSSTYAVVKPALESSGISTFRQGEDERSRLLGRFRTDVASVLFATESFWEGVDAPGEALEVVIICRLPFRVPTEPVLVARTEALRARGGNPFFELALPEAVMKLKQGFGRLMRKRTDRGIVLITDGRIVKKAYGSLFLQSLPRTRKCVADGARVISEIESFLYTEVPRIPDAGT